MHEAWQKGDVATVRQINERLMPLHDALFAETSPAPVKYAASLLGRCSAGGAPAAVADDAGDAGEGARRDARRRADQLGRLRGVREQRCGPPIATSRKTAVPATIT